MSTAVAAVACSGAPACVEIDVDPDDRAYPCASSGDCGDGWCCDHRWGAPATCRAMSDPACSAELACASSSDAAVCAGGAGLCSDGRCVEGPADMVVVAGATLLLGCSGKACDVDNEPPELEASVPGFFVDRTELSAGTYAAHCLDTCGGSGEPDNVSAGLDHHPANRVSWSRAACCCAALDRRLCAEAEWELAAGTQHELRYPWGDDEPDCEDTNFAACHAEVTGAETRPVDDPQGHPAGLRHLAGNVREWTADCWYLDYSTNPRDGGAAPCEDDDQPRVLRGGGMYDEATTLTTTYRWPRPPETTYDGDIPLGIAADVGFRCCATP